MAQLVERLPLAQIMIPRSQDGAPLSGEPVCPSPAPPAHALSLSLSNEYDL